MQLYTPDGARKYLTAAERDAFLAEAARADRAVQTLCMTLAYSGCRLSEALALTVDRVDLGAGALVFESLKKRRDGIYRAVPVPPALLEALVMAHGVRELQARRGRGRGVRLWPWSRMTGWRAVHGVMAGRRARRAARLAQGAAARLRGGRRHRRHPAQPGAEMARPRPALHHRDLRRRRRRRGEGHRPAHVDVSRPRIRPTCLRLMSNPFWPSAMSGVTDWEWVCRLNPELGARQANLGFGLTRLG